MLGISPRAQVRPLWVMPYISSGFVLLKPSLAAAPGDGALLSLLRWQFARGQTPELPPAPLLCFFHPLCQVSAVCVLG